MALLIILFSKFLKRDVGLIADVGYHNGAEIAYSERRGVRPFVAVSKVHSDKPAGFRKDDFVFDKQTDGYICPSGEKLTYQYTFTLKGSGRKYRVKRYGGAPCGECALRNQCTQSLHGRYIDRPNHQAFVDRNNARVRKYPEVYQLRQQVIEHIFGTWKRQWGMDHTILKTRDKVITEYRLAPIAYNLLRTVSIKGQKWLEKKLKKLLLIKINTVFLYGSTESEIPRRYNLKIAG